jgi:hypothetical protein
MSYSLGHHNTTTLSSELLKNNLNPVFFETGTNVGQGVISAINAGFKKIISIEIVPDFIEIVKSKFLNVEEYSDINFNFHLGDSKTLLPEIIKNIDERVTFWLDGHEFHKIPLIDELLAIKNHKIRDHIIMIDDVRMFNSPDWDNIGHENIVKLIMEINSDYKITYHNSPHGINDILIAKI